MDYNSTCSAVTAVANNGYVFNGWTGDYESDENPLKIPNIKSDLNITANFAPEVVEESGENENGGTGSNGGVNCFINSLVN